VRATPTFDRKRHYPRIPSVNHRTRPEQILIVRLAALGDVARATAIVERARRERPGARLTWVVDAGGAPLLHLVAGIDRVVTVSASRLFSGSAGGRLLECLKLWRALAGTTYDLAVLAHADRRYRLLIAGVRARKTRILPPATRDSRAFMGDEFASLLGDRPVSPGEFPVTDLRESVRAVELPLGFGPSGRPTVMLLPGGARNLLRDDPLRRWPLMSYVTLAGELLASGHDVILLGAESDRWVQPAFEGLGVRDFIGRLDLSQTLRLMAEPGISVVTHDTGPLHLAHLVRARIVALFGPTVPSRVVGAADNITSLWGGAHLPCRPCYDGRDYAPCSRNLCLENVSVADVIHALGADDQTHAARATPVAS
jgi:heptosyltransferase II